MTLHLDESIIIGTLQISGSDAIKRKKVAMVFSASNMASSILTSTICAPLATCSRAISSAWPYSPSRINRANFADPATLVRSPTLTKPVTSFNFKGSKPLSADWGAASGTTRGFAPSKVSAISLIWGGVVPQQPPTILTKPLSANSRNCAAMYSGLSSYPPKAFGKPAFG